MNKKPIETVLEIMLNPLVASIYVGFVILSYCYFDLPIASYFETLDLASRAPLLKGITNLGLGGVYIPGFLCLALFFRYIKPNKVWEQKAWVIWFCVIIPSVLCLILKILLGRARPSMFFVDHYYGFYGLGTKASFWSFPSGHTSTITGLVIGLSLVFPRYTKGWLAAGAMIAITRILLVSHYLSDVMAAFYLAGIEIGILLWFCRQNAALSARCGALQW